MADDYISNDYILDDHIQNDHIFDNQYLNNYTYNDHTSNSYIFNQLKDKIRYLNDHNSEDNSPIIIYTATTIYSGILLYIAVSC